MPYREDSVGVVATFPFADANDASSSGEIVLRDDGRIQFVPSAALRKGLDKVVDRVDTGGLKWGTTLVVGLAALGAGLFRRGSRSAAYTVFAASGLTGVGAFAARRYVRSLEDWLLSPLPLDQVQITPDVASGGIRVYLNGGGMRKLVAVISPTDFNRADADAFLLALKSAGQTDTAP